jgi:diguanylate cyclase (GGDEF)-like protein
LYFDVDDFKRVNDNYGHEGGDQMLMEFSARLTEHLRNEDVLARMGGDEFALIMGGAHSEQDVLVMANNILTMMQHPFLIRGQEVQTSTSIGITMSANDEADPEVLLQHADLAMYEAKSLGKNTFHFYTKELNETAKERQTIERALQDAIKNNDLQLHYQPKVDARGNQLIGFEALLRWIDEELGFVSPARFVPIAEQSNLILKLGSWVMEEAIRFASTLESQTPVSINLSARQFDSGTCVDELRGLLDKYQVDAGMIELEITESHLASDVEDAIEQLKNMKGLGVHISIDDFGTGYSSLSYLKRFPVDTLKIDRSFIKDIPGDTNDVEITGAIIARAQKLGLQVIAEGAETKEQIDFLIDNECYFVQGYYFSKPLPEEDARNWRYSQS